MTELNWPPGTRPRRPVKAPLSRPEIVRTALGIVRAEGIDAVSMRRVAAEFDTGPSSLYAHVRNKDELLALMFDEVCGEVEVPEIDAARWKEQVKDLARAGHAAMLRYNDLARAALATIPTGPNALRISNAMFGMMLAGGIPPRIAAWAMDRIFLYLTADAYEYSIWGPNSRPQSIEALGANVLAYFKQLPPDVYPHVVKHADALVGGSNDERFDLGLELLIDGLDKYATTPP